MERPRLIFNFIGVCVADWRAAYRFFNETLGIRSKLEPKHGDWAVFGGAWDAYYQQNSRSAIFELFDLGRVVTERYWGLNQGIRPGFHVSALQRAVDRLSLPCLIEERPWGKTAEFSTVEGIRFALTEIPNTPFSDDLSVPYIGHVAIRCANFEAMQDFYSDILGFTKAEAGADHVVLTQPDGFPSVILERGGHGSKFDPHNTPWENNAVRAFPVFPSLMTTDIRSAYTYLQSRHVTVLRDLISNQDWGGSDVHIADPDGNGIQVVQYG